MTIPADRLNEIGVLKRREIEARFVAPLVTALAEEFGREKVLEVLRQTVVAIARQQGAELAARLESRGLPEFGAALEDWRRDDALELQVLASSEDELAFDVTRCRYAEMYRALGIPELGALLSCNRDAALMDGYNPEVDLVRDQTLMQGAPRCAFRYRRRRPPAR